MEVWQKVFLCINVNEDCSNILHLIKLMVTIPFLNTKKGRLSSRMNRISRIDLKNQLSHNQLDLDDCLRIGEEGVAVDAFNPDPATKLWLSNWACCLNSSPHKLSICVKTGICSEGNYKSRWIYYAWFREQWWWVSRFLYKSTI